MSDPHLDRIRSALSEGLAPLMLELENESQLHAGMPVRPGGRMAG